MKKYFFKEMSSEYLGKFIIKMDLDEFPNIRTLGSYSIMPARLMNLTYANYCRMCRDLFGAEIRGKNKLYPTVYFNDDESLAAILKLLNKKMEMIMIMKTQEEKI